MTSIKQLLLNFCEGRSIKAGRLTQKRAAKFGDNSWCWKWTFWQECFWDRLGWRLEEPVENK